VGLPNQVLTLSHPQTALLVLLLPQVYDADATPSYGTDTLEGFFAKALKEGLKGQELGDQAVFGVGE
jgi:divinyl chlorophyllide a 8-vinyl-reductase